jgi:microcystin degradation protein MlrC
VESFGVRAPAEACSQRDESSNISPDGSKILELKNKNYLVAELALILAELALLVTESVARNAHCPDPCSNKK